MKAASFSKMEYDTRALSLSANMSNKIVALKIDTIQP